MRAIWKGNLSFALVTIPISLFRGTRSDELSFKYLHKKDLSSISYKRFCDAEGREVPWEEITRGYEFEKGRHIEISKEDFEKADVEVTSSIRVLEFVDDGAIDPVYFHNPYYLEPPKGAERAYAVMCEALAQRRKVAIAKIVLKCGSIWHRCALGASSSRFRRCALRTRLRARPSSTCPGNRMS